MSSSPEAALDAAFDFEQLAAAPLAERQLTVREAQTQAQAIVARAEAEADRIRNEAQLKDPQFYAFLRKLEDYQRILGDGKSTLLLSTHREIFDTLFNPPRPSGKEKRDEPQSPRDHRDKHGGERQGDK